MVLLLFSIDKTLHQMHPDIRYLGATMITINIPLKIGSGENAVTVQSIFDDIVPNILCLGAFGVVFYR